MTALSRAVALWGTEEARGESRELSAGPLSAVLEGGALRGISYAGTEVIRGIAFLCRDKNWATYNAELSGLEIDEGDAGFRVTYRGRCADGEQALGYEVEIAGSPDGACAFKARATAETDFLTNRTGFIVLHPLVGVAGQPVRVEHVTGQTVEDRFPLHVAPSQPFFDIRSLSHEVVPGLWATCTMEGDAYEMEDQRNWTDASYKTYVRPLSLPRPYTIKAGDEIQQSVTLTFEGEPAHPEPIAHATVATVVSVEGGTSGAMPEIGLAVTPETVDAALENGELVAAIGPQNLVCWLDARQLPAEGVLRAYAKLAETVGARVVLELILPAEAAPAEELRAPAGAVVAAGLRPAAVTVSPAPYLKSYQPNEAWPDIPPLEDYYDASRAAFPGALIGGGMLSYFTELNRKRPPADRVDYVSHTTCATIHDADDRSVMETLEALPYVIETTRAFIDRKPYRVGPSAIGMRDNPYGEAPLDNPGNARVAMARNDPRQRGLFGAAWSLGYAAHMARGGISALTLAAPAGEFGVIAHRMPHAQPYFDDLDRPAIYPVYHVIAGLAAAAGRPRLEARSTAPSKIDCLAWDVDGVPVVWVVNLTAGALEFSLAGLPSGGYTARVLDEGTFAEASVNSGFMREGASPLDTRIPMAIGAYGTVVITPAA